MVAPKRFAWSVVLFQYVLSRRARLIYLALLLLLIAVSVGVRVRSYLITRKIQAVLSGLSRVRVDATTEEQLLKTVPYLVPEPRRGSTVLYRAEIANHKSVVWWPPLPEWFYRLGPSPRWASPDNSRWQEMTVPTKLVYLLGWRHLAFSAWVTVVDGVVSSTSYYLEPDVFFGAPKPYFVVARSAHGFWIERNDPLPVPSIDEERPEYRFGRVAGQFSWLPGVDDSIGVAYTPEAPPEFISHVFQLDLSCFWSIGGCASVQQVAPFLWQERRATEAATAMRLSSADPCPDRILAERVRHLPDLNIALLEVINARFEDINTEGDHSSELVTDYRLKEVIRGNPKGPFTGIRRGQRSPLSPNEMVANPLPKRFPKPGDRMLYFSGAKFDSCRIVPATPSAEASVRNAIPAPKRNEDSVQLHRF